MNATDRPPADVDRGGSQAMIQVLVHEPAPLWTAELQRFFLADETVAVRWSPYFEELLREAERGGVPLAILVFEREDEAALERIGRLTRRRPGLKLALLTTEDDPHWEWIAREQGADVVLPDTVEKHRATTAIARLLRRT